MPASKKFCSRISDGLCGFCGLIPLVNKTECEDCRSSRRSRQKKEYIESGKLNDLRDQWRDRVKQCLCIRCGKEKTSNTKTCEICLEKQKLRETEFKNSVYQKYGGYVCFCCGETIKEFLTLDHIHNDGSKHRKELKQKGSGKNLYRWIVENNFPPIFQVACYNCNCGRKINNGVCPHKHISK